MREFVHEPMNTVSTAMSRIGVPAFRPMYASARFADSRADASANASGSGTDVVDRIVCAGFVPHDTCGRSVAASMHDFLVERGVGVGDERRASRRAPVPTSAPFGANGRPSRYANVVSSGAIEPGARAGFDRHVADRHAAFHRQRADRASRGTR